MDTASDAQRYVSSAIMAVISFYGIIANAMVFIGLIASEAKLSGFFKVCASKTVSNTIICISFLFWSVPCTLINKYYLTHQGNILIGQFGGWCPYIMGPFTQLCMAFNRFIAIYLPNHYNKSTKFNVTNLALAFFWSLAIVLAALGTPVGCGFIYNVKRLAWEPENQPCAVDFATFYFYLVVVMAVVTNSVNLTIIVRLLTDSAKTAISHDASMQRRNRRTKMFIQSVAQDCLHVIDMINCSKISHLRDEVWYVFIFSSLSFLGIHVMDGTVMLLFNKNLRAQVLRLLKRNPKLTPLTTVFQSSNKNRSFS